MTLASATTVRDSRRVEPALELAAVLQVALSAAVAGEAAPLPHQRHRRPDTDRPRMLRWRTSWPRQAKPQWGQRDHDRVETTETTSWSMVSTTTASARSNRKCRRTCIVSGDKGLLDLDASDTPSFTEAPAHAGGSPRTRSSHVHAPLMPGMWMSSSTRSPAGDGRSWRARPRRRPPDRPRSLPA